MPAPETSALFFLAFLPQSVEASGSVAERIRRSPVVRRRLDRGSAAVLVGLGAAAALTGSRRAV